VTPFVPITDGAQVVVVFTLGGEVVSNRLWFVSRSPPITTTTLQALCDGVYGWYTGQVLPLLSSDLQLAAVEGFDWTADPSPITAATGPAVNGGSAVESHSANVADRIWFYSSASPDRIRNSHFIPGIPTDKVNLNTVDITFRSDVRDGYINLIDLAASFGSFPAWRWVCASAWEAGSLRTEQRVLRTDFIRYKRPWVAQRRKRLPV